MTETDFQEVGKKTKKRKKHGNRNVITFDEEVVPKHVAEQLLSNEIKEEQINDNEHPTHKKQKKRKKQKLNVNESKESDITHNKRKSSENEQEEIILGLTKAETPPQKKKKKDLHSTEKNDDTNEPSQPKKLSIRAQKRLKHAKLIEENRLKTDCLLQQKSLNYLSKWKHSRSDWKFEKLRQIWLQQNMFDDGKIPDDFWESLLEYFGGSRGKARQVLIKKALKIVEDENADEEGVTVKRARDIIQSLDE